MPKWGYVEFPFTSGINTKVDSKNVKWPYLINLENAIFTEVGTIKKRTGYDRLSITRRYLDTSKSVISSNGPGGTLSPKALMSRNSELVYFDNKYLYSKLNVSEGAANDSMWLGKDRFVSCIPSHKNLFNRTDAQYYSDYAESSDSNAAILAWVQEAGANSNLYVSLIDSSTDSVIATHLVTANGYFPRCRLITDGTFTRLVLFYMEGSSVPLSIKSIDWDVGDFETAAIGGLPSATTIASDVSVRYDVQAGPTYAILAYHQDSTDDMVVHEIDERGVSVSNTTVTTTMLSSPSITFRTYGGTTKAAVTWEDSSGVNSIIFEDGTSTYVGATQISTTTSVSRITSEWEDDDTFHVYFDKAVTVVSEPTYEIHHVEVDETALSSTDNGAVLFNCGIDSHAFSHDGQIFLPVYNDDLTELQPSCYLYLHALDMVDSAGSSDPKFILTARYLYGERYKPPGGYNKEFIPSFSEVSSGVFKAGTATITRLGARDPNNETAPSSVFSEQNAAVVTLDFSSTDNYQWAQVGDSIYFTGGMLWKYDGDIIEECGFTYFPETEDHTVNTSGALSYSYRFYWEKIDANSEIDQSTFAGILTIDSMADPPDVDFTFANIPHTRRIWDNLHVRLAAYRSEQDPGPDALFHRITDLDPEVTGDNGYVEVDPESATSTLSDTLADSSLTSNEFDYQSTGELQHVSPPSPAIIGFVKNRLWLAGGEIPENVVIFSMQKRTGRPVQFNDRLFIRFEKDGGSIKSIASLNQNVVIFKEKKIFLVTGDGPNNVGQGFFNEPIELATDVGCINQRTVVEIPDGLIFQSRKGFYILRNDLSLDYIGAFVEAYNDQTFTRATIVPDSNHVIFLTASGSTLLYDYLVNAWGVWTNHNGVDSVVCGNVYHYLTGTSATIYKSNSSEWTDNATQYAKKLSTPWITQENSQTQWRCREMMILGNFKDNHTFRVNVYYDYDESTSDIVDMNPPTAAETVYQLRIPLPRQKFQAVRFDITETVGSPDEGYEIQRLQLKVMDKGHRFAIRGDKSGGTI